MSPEAEKKEPVLVDTQQSLFTDGVSDGVRPLRGQLLKWIGNKQRVAPAIISCFPEFKAYHEPFLGTGAVLATLGPRQALASDVFGPLIEIFQELKSSPASLKSWYADRWTRFQAGDRVEGYEAIKADFNRSPNGADLVFLCRACYGGVVRFRKADGYMSTPCGVHNPISPDSFAKRVDVWAARVTDVTFKHCDYRAAFSRANAGDLVYCDPPYTDSQSILYGAQAFSFRELLECIAEAKNRGVYVALSIDGTKKSGKKVCELSLPEGLFEEEVLIDLGRSMLRRFQLQGQTLEHEIVRDRLLLTY